MEWFNELQSNLINLHSDAVKKNMLPLASYLKEVEDQIGLCAEKRREAKKMAEMQASVSRKLQSASDTKGKKIDKVFAMRSCSVLNFILLDAKRSKVIV